MKEKVKITILIVLFLSLIYMWGYIAFTPSRDKTSIFIEKINELELKIDSLSFKKDSVRVVIDSTHIKIISNEKQYKEIVNTIINQPTDSDYLFVLGYLRQHRSQRDSLNMY